MGWVVGWVAGGPYSLSRRRYLLGKLESEWTRKIVGFKGHTKGTLEKAMAPHSSILAWRIPGTGEPGGQPSMGLHRVGHD